MHACTRDHIPHPAKQLPQNCMGIGLGNESRGGWKLDFLKYTVSWFGRSQYHNKLIDVAKGTASARLLCQD